MARYGVGMMRESAELGRARGDLWLPTPLIDAVDGAAAYVDRLGFAVLFPAEKIQAPSLWEAVAGPDAVPFEAGMGPAEAQVWAWKDELPKAGLAWYGKFVYKRASLLSPRLLTALYAGSGEPTDHEAFELPVEAHRIAEALIPGPLPTAALREIVGDRGRYDRAMTALQRCLLITSAGVREQGSGWPTSLIELTCRRFDVGGGLDHAYATKRFVDTMIEGTTAQLARTYAWPTATARTHLDEAAR